MCGLIIGPGDLVTKNAEQIHLQSMVAIACLTPSLLSKVPLCELLSAAFKSNRQFALSVPVRHVLVAGTVHSGGRGCNPSGGCLGQPLPDARITEFSQFGDDVAAAEECRAIPCQSQF